MLPFLPIQQANVEILYFCAKWESFMRQKCDESETELTKEVY